MRCLPSLIVLVGFWIPPAVAGWVAARPILRAASRSRVRASYAVLVILVLSYAAGWFLLNLAAMPPYVPGSTKDPTFAPPEAVAGLAVVTGTLVSPGSELAYALAFRYRRRLILRATPSPDTTQQGA